MASISTRIGLPKLALKLGTKGVLLAGALVVLTTAGVVFAAYQSLSSNFASRARADIDRRPVSEAAVAEEISRFEKALVQTRHQLLEVQRRVSEAMGAHESSIFDSHLLVLEDPMLLDEVIRLIRNEKVNAEYAFHTVSERYAATLAATTRLKIN